MNRHNYSSSHRRAAGNDRPATTLGVRAGYSRVPSNISTRTSLLSPRPTGAPGCWGKRGERSQTGHHCNGTQGDLHRIRVRDDCVGVAWGTPSDGVPNDTPRPLLDSARGGGPTRELTRRKLQHHTVVINAWNGIVTDRSGELDIPRPPAPALALAPQIAGMAWQGRGQLCSLCQG